VEKQFSVFLELSNPSCINAIAGQNRLKIALRDLQPKQRTEKFDKKFAEVVVLPTSQAIDVLNKNPEATNAILHVTC